MKELLGHNTRPRIVTACCGAGSDVASLLWRTPGASEYLLSCYFPYHKSETIDFLGFEPDKFVSEETAINLALESYMRASRIAFEKENPVGIGLTASVASLMEHRGDHRVCFAGLSNIGACFGTLTLEKGIGPEARALDDQTCTNMVSGMLQMLAIGEVPIKSSSHALDQFRKAFMARPFFGTGPDVRRAMEPHHGVFFPGNFDPMHFGHEGIAETVAKMTQQPVIPWICTKPPHKEPLSVQQMARRAAEMRARLFPVMFSDGDPLYIDKARRFPGRYFIIGADALVRMLDPKWGPLPGPMLDEFYSLGIRFWVVPRIIDGKLTSLEDVDTLGFPGLFRPVHGTWNISSTQVRQKKSVS